MSLRRTSLCLCCWWLLVASVSANVPGGGTGTGPNVTRVDNGSTVTLANGIVSILCTKSGATINQINYTYNNGSGTTTTQLLAGGNNGGQLYWELGGFGSGSFTYTLVADPAGNGGDYAEISLLSTSATAGTMEVHFSLLRGSTGFYVTAIWSHRSVDAAMTMGETRDNIYAGSIFNWMSVDAARNRLMQVSGGTAMGVFNAPAEVTLWTSGLYAGRYEDKYCYSADLGVQRAWGWSSVGAGGKNVGLWNVSASAEYYNGGPMKRELMSHIGTTILNMHNGSHYGGGTDGSWAAGEIWTKVYGPYFIYCNNVTNTITDPTQASSALYADALAQAAAEQTAWPYSWFTNANYAPVDGRGTVTGTIVINDSGNPNASAAGLWVGLVQQPSTTDNVYDFQDWMKPYQFWVKCDTNGNFNIPDVIAGANYTLYAFGPGAAGTFQSQAQVGGSAPNTLDIPASPFSVTVMGGTTNDLGDITWTPTRVGPTVFEIGYPNRTGDKFRHGDDYWVGDIGPSPTAPSPIWSKHLAYPLEFPTGPNYVVGQSRWSTDWDYVQPIVTDSAGNFNGSTSTITFDLAAAPAGGAQASFYIALSSDFQGPLIIQVNGNNIAGSTGYFPAYSGSSSGSDTTIRQGIHGCFSDNRITFAGSLLHAGQNTITINMRKGGYFANHAMYDYLRLELTGYVPPAPSNVAAYPGNNCNLVCWRVMPGATSYNILRSTTSGTGYSSVTNGAVGPVCGSGPANAAWLDTSAVNGTTYYYVVQSVNPAGTSTNSSESAGVTPSAGLSTNAPAAPTGLAATPGNSSVTLTWNPAAGANYYTVQRSTVVDNGVGSYVSLSTITLNNTNTGTTYADTTAYNGTTYRYFVRATSAGGPSSNSAPAQVVPLPPPPATAPTGFGGSIQQFINVALTWSPVSGAIGYILQRATSSGGPYTLEASITETAYTDSGLSFNTTNYYQLAAVNVAGTSSNTTFAIITPPAAPASLGATAGNTQILLNWAASAGATNYILKRGSSSGNETTTVATLTGTSYIDTNLVNGTAYYYVVAATGKGGTGPNSPEAHATPGNATVAGLLWTGATSSIWNTTTTNWLDDLNPAVYADGDDVTFNDSGGVISLSTAATVVPGSVTFANATVNYTVTGGGNGISGTTSLVKTNAGTVTLAGTHTYTGGTIVNAGRVTFSVGTAIPATGSVTLNNTGAVTVTSANSLPSVLVNGVNAITGNGNSGTGIGTLDVEGTLTLFVSGGSSVFDLTGPTTGPGTLVLGGSAMTLRFNGTAGDGNAIFNLGNGTAVANVRKTSTTAIALGGLAGGPGTQLQGDNSAGGANMTYTIGGANANTEFDGAINDGTVGTVALIKAGAGTLKLTNWNSYSGGTTINGGALQINSRSGSGTGPGTVVVANGGTLTGNGIISGPVTVNSGGALAPGSPLGTLTISNNLTLNAGSTNFVQIQHSPLTNDSIRITGTLTEGGTLNVTNTGVAAFTLGDSFNLFIAANYSSAFANFVLPSLTGNLVWNTNTLKNSGTLSVVVLTPPTIASVKLIGGDLSFSGSGGVNSWPFLLLASTNLSLPPMLWTPIATSQFDAGGNFALTITNGFALTAPPTFFRLQLR